MVWGRRCRPGVLRRDDADRATEPALLRVIHVPSVPPPTITLRRSGRAVAIHPERSMRRCKARHRHAVRAARHVIQPDLFAERDGGWVAAMLAANADLEVGFGGAALFGTNAHHRADAVDVDGNERIL